MRNEILRYLGHRPIPITPKRLATSQYSGEWTSPYIGKGMEFKSHRPFQLGDDLRSISMSMSIRAGKRMVTERIATRDISIYVLIDCSASMGDRHKADMLMVTSMMLIYSGVSREMRVGAALITGEGYHGLGIGMSHRHTLRLLDKVEESCMWLKQGRELSLEFLDRRLYRLLPTGCILVYISDFLDERGNPDPSLPFVLNTRRYDFVPIVVQDEFEYSFPEFTDSTLLELQNPETGDIYPVWMGPKERRQVKEIHQQRFSELKGLFKDRGTGYVHVSDPEIEQIHKALTQYFVYR
jgi:uncharacterized protein (DUF58 family)